MSGTGPNFSNQLLKLIFNGTAIANIADNASSSPLTNLYAALHTADPSGSDSQTTSEAAYGSYARVAVARTTGGWTASGRNLSPVSDITFPTATSGSETETFASIGIASSGTGQILFSFPLSPSIAVSTSVAPKIKAASSFTEN